MKRQLHVIVILILAVLLTIQTYRLARARTEAENSFNRLYLSELASAATDHFVILQRCRDGKTEEAIRVLELFIDDSLESAGRQIDENGIPAWVIMPAHADWEALEQDRLTHTRKALKPEKEQRINKAIELFKRYKQEEDSLRKQPQQGRPPYAKPGAAE